MDALGRGQVYPNIALTVVVEDVIEGTVKTHVVVDGLGRECWVHS